MKDENARLWAVVNAAAMVVSDAAMPDVCPLCGGDDDHTEACRMGKLCDLLDKVFHSLVEDEIQKRAAQSESVETQQKEGT